MFGKPCILILEDHDDLREMIKFQFDAKGYQTIAVANGVDGLNVMKKISPDLIIMDINMPKMGGIEFYENICDDNEKPPCPIMVVTARKNLEQFFMDFEVQGFMTKPVDLDLLFEEVNIILTQRERQHENFKEERVIKEVFIIENDQESYKRIDKVFLNSGYKIRMQRTGLDAIEDILKSPPHLVLANLSLVDIPGDVIALRLKCMTKTCDVKSLVYIDSDHVQHDAVMLNIKKKTGVSDLVRYTDPQELLDAVDRVLKPRY